MSSEYTIRWPEFIKAYVPTIITWVFLGALLGLPNYSYGNALMQSICLLFWSYAGHVLAHKVSTHWPFNILNPHVYIHHNKLITLNRTLELIIEAMVNFFGFFVIIILQWLTSIHIFSTTIVLGSAFLYIAIHILDYSLFPNEYHKLHHEKHLCNYDPTFMDTLFNTQCDKEKPYRNMVAEIPHAIIAFGLAYLFKLYFQLD